MFIIGKDNHDKLAYIGKDGTEKVISENKSFIQWVQEYSKKIVTVTFVLFIIIEFVSLLMILIEYIRIGDSMHLDILIQEANLTFREVIGGYIVKAAMENVSKGFSAIMDKYFQYKIDSLEFESKQNQDEGPIMEDGEESDL